MKEYLEEIDIRKIQLIKAINLISSEGTAEKSAMRSKKYNAKIMI